MYVLHITCYCAPRRRVAVELHSFKESILEKYHIGTPSALTSRREPTRRWATPLIRTCWW